MKLLERERKPIPITFLPVPQETNKNGSQVSDDYLRGSEDGLIVSEEVYWEKYYHHPDFNYEWANGRLEEKPVSNLETSRMYGWLLKLLELFLEAHQIAELTRLETGFVVPLSPKKEKARLERLEKERSKRVTKKKKKKKENGAPPRKIREHVRKPDLGVILNSNPVPYNGPDNSYHGVADLCIEAISYTTKKAKERDIIVKKEEYEYAKVKEYYILDDSKVNTHFYRLNRWGVYEEIKPVDGDVIKSEVLPGFQFRISDLYRQPKQEELVKDEVYQGFIMLKYQASEKKAKAEKERADRLQEEKDQLQADKDRLMALLQQMGISID